MSATASLWSNYAIFIANGTKIYSLGLSARSGENQLTSFQTPLNGARELTIAFINDDPNPMTNAVMWDITLTEVNTGQKMLNSMKEILRSMF